jgi:hypothetical protein
MVAETENGEEEYHQLPFVEDVSEYRWAKEEEVNDALFGSHQKPNCMFRG